MKKTNKSSMRDVVVICLNSKEEFKIDIDIHDNIYIEAATRILEHKNKTSGEMKVSPTMICYIKEDEKDSNKQFICNTYFMLINAGMYEKAERLRSIFLKTTNIDLKDESVISTNNSDILTG